MLYSIGHSNQSAEAFVALLKLHGIAAVHDVRASPFSRYNPQFNRAALERTLTEEGIGYAWVGDRLGGKGACCTADGLAALAVETAKADIAMMCAERDPLDCHRTWAIAERLPDIEIRHILGGGRIVTHRQLMAGQQARLL